MVSTLRENLRIRLRQKNRTKNPSIQLTLIFIGTHCAHVHLSQSVKLTYMSAFVMFACVYVFERF